MKGLKNNDIIKNLYSNREIIGIKISQNNFWNFNFLTLYKKIFNNGMKFESNNLLKIQAIAIIINQINKNLK